MPLGSLLVSLVALAAVALAGCGGDGSNGDVADGAEAELAGTPLARFLPDGPVHGVVMATGVDEGGVPLERATTFAAAAPNVTAVVALGAVAAEATLAVEWRRIGPEIDASEMLFAHEIGVKPFQRAYSVGVSEGALASGLYEVTASLGEHEVSTLWRVADEQGSSASARDESARPPTAGESGAVDVASSTAAAAGSGDCDRLTIAGHDDLRFVVEYDVDANRSMLAGVDCPPAVASATVVGSAVDVATYPPSFRDYVHPCDLPGGSDMPGTVVHLAARYAGDESEPAGHEVELVDPEEPPIVGLRSRPASGSRVEPGDTVTLAAEVLRLPAARGLRWAELRSPAGVLAREERDATPCDLDRLYIHLEATYTVPDDPPPVIELTAAAEDHDGLATTERITLVTEERWEGTMRSETRRTYMNPENAGQACTDAWESDLRFTVDGAGSVDGKGEATLVEGPACDFPAGHAFTLAKKALFTVEGEADESGFTLRLGIIRWAPATGASIAGFHNVLATGAGTMNATAPGPAFEIPKLDSCRAKGEFTARATVGAFEDPTVAKNTVKLRCPESEAG